MTLFGPLGGATGWAGTPVLGSILRPPKPCTRAAIVATAHSWERTRYHAGQSKKGLGVDCYGLVLGVGLEHGFPSAIAASNDPDCKGYGPAPNRDKLLAACTKYLKPIAMSDAGLGDLYLMRWEEEPHHFAIISSLDPWRVIHAYAAIRKCCETSIDGEWRKGIPWSSLIVSAWRYRELAD